jgi:thymidylate kinase
VRFADCSALAVDVIGADDWGLPAAALRSLQENAVSVDGLARVVRPGPAHTLLVIAKQVAAANGRLSEKKRKRIDAAVADDPDAWRSASSLAEGWSMRGELEALRDVWANGTSHRRLPRPRRGAVIALSGLDGAGKSSQARALGDALERLGFGVRIVWTPIGNNPLQRRIASAAKRVLGKGSDERMLSTRGEATSAPGAHGLAAATWATVGAGFNGGHHLRSAAADVARGRIVIFDRYVLDSLVQIRFAYGTARPLRLPRALVRGLSIPPARAFLLDVRPETALARKDDRWTLDDLKRQAQLYREEAARLGVTRLDGEAPKEELCARIARDVFLTIRRGSNA